MKNKICMASLLILLSINFSLVAQFEVHDLFNKGIEFYRQQKYSEAQRTFFDILKNHPQSNLQTVVKLMLAKSYYKLEDYPASLLVIEDFIGKYPESSYLDDIYFLKGDIHYRQNDYTQAIENWQWVIYNGTDNRLKKLAGEYVFHTLELFLTERQISALSKKYPDDLFTGLVEIVQAKKMINSGQVEEGESRLQKFVEEYPYHFYAETAANILRDRKGTSLSSNTILIIKSSQEENKKISDAIAKGFLYAAYEMSQRDKQKVVQIDTLSVPNNVLRAIEQTMEYLEKKHPLAVVGPIDDDQSTALALLSRYEYFPFISPLSSEKGLAAISPYAFQINPDAEIKGRFLAEYAVKELGLKTFATLAPADEYGMSIIKGFEETITENNAEIVEKQWYYENTTDFSRQFKVIRHKGFYLTFRDSVLAVDSTLSEEIIQENYKKYLNEILFSESTRREIDSTQVASKGIDGLFIATYPEYIPYIAPQFAFQNIQTQLLGNEGWNNADLLAKHRLYLDGLIYITAGYFDPQSWNYTAFVSRFRQQMQESPEVYHLLGYDLGKWMITQYEPGINRGVYRDKLIKGELYQGMLENIDFGIKPRVNSQLNIIKFYRGQILKMK